MSLTYADEHRELAEELDERLRAAVRLDGIDPQRDTGQVRVLARRLWPTTTSGPSLGSSDR